MSLSEAEADHRHVTTVEGRCCCRLREERYPRESILISESCGVNNLIKADEPSSNYGRAVIMFG